MANDTMFAPNSALPAARIYFEVRSIQSVGVAGRISMILKQLVLLDSRLSADSLQSPFSVCKWELHLTRNGLHAVCRLWRAGRLPALGFGSYGCCTSACLEAGVCGVKRVVMRSEEGFEAWIVHVHLHKARGLSVLRLTKR